jgi:hypothetical protein
MRHLIFFIKVLPREVRHLIIHTSAGKAEKEAVVASGARPRKTWIILAALE